ncbi:hypothetical protein [Chelativorans sp. AA-79]|uniref:hypothetical protein n=1 Tax=Chelativorans sp. AA-79 TaxID=3028735 RepID=UPI0023F6C068|nr:hypothetical protein [Chelativorans sp. AA-79]WEX10349.1 hypothetical protein PVE73_05145 [Chelativorans sp. AA-79]
MTKPLRAYTVTEEYENTGAVIFAVHNVVARRLGANEYADGEFSAVSCRRAPWADAYAGKPIPARVMIAHGWHFECSECGACIDEDWLCDNGLPLEGVIGTQHSHVFCGSRCARRYYSLRRRRKAEEQRAIEAFKAIVRRRFPDADFCDEADGDRFRERHHAYVIPGRGGWHWKQVVIAFRFPGMKIGPAHFRMDGNYRMGPDFAGYTCCAGDKEAFEAYAKATRRAADG